MKWQKTLKWFSLWSYITCQCNADINWYVELKFIIMHQIALSYLMFNILYDYQIYWWIKKTFGQHCGTWLPCCLYVARISSPPFTTYSDTIHRYITFTRSKKYCTHSLNKNIVISPSFILTINWKIKRTIQFNITPRLMYIFSCLIQSFIKNIM